MAIGIVAAIAMVVTMFAGIGSYFASNNNSAGNTSGKVSATVKKATLGSSVTVKLNGNKNYKTAVKYQISNEKGELISPLAPISSPTTVFPARKSGDKVNITFYDSTNKKIGIEKVSLQGN